MEAMRVVSRMPNCAPWLVVPALVLSVEGAALAEDTKDGTPDHTIILGVGCRRAAGSAGIWAARDGV
jgi:hypothetical protein